MSREQKRSLLLIAAAAVLLIGLHFVPVTGWLKLVLYLIPYLLVGGETLVDACKGCLLYTSCMKMRMPVCRAAAPAARSTMWRMPAVWPIRWACRTMCSIIKTRFVSRSWRALPPPISAGRRRTPVWTATAT